MTQPQPTLGLSELRAGAHQLSQQRREARRDYERYSKEAAEADRLYRIVLAKRFASKKADGLSDKRAEVEANAAAAEYKLKRDLATSLAKSALLRIEECERDSATLRSIGEWSQRIDGVAA